MISFKRMSLMVYKRENGEPMVALEARDRVPDHETSNPDPDREGITYLSFYFEYDEFKGFMTGKVNTVNDLRHNVKRSGEICTFYDMELPNKGSGVVNCPYINLTIPYHVGRILVGMVDDLLLHCVAGGERLSIELSYEDRIEWGLTYGEGT